MSLSHDKPSLDELMHYGVKRRSGRYPWGSGEEPYQRTPDFATRVDEMRKSGMDDKEICKFLGIKSTTQLRKDYRITNNARKERELEKVLALQEKGISNYKIADMMGYSNESTVRSMTNPDRKVKYQVVKGTYDHLKKQLEENKYIDIGKGAERGLNISRGKLDEAVYRLEMEGYVVHKRHIDQPTNPGKKVTVKTLCRPGTELKDLLAADVSEIKSLKDYTTNDDGQTFHKKFEYPKSMDSKRLMIRYKEDGGEECDGLVELRRGVDDLSLGNDRVSQVRILVDNDRYIKGMAVYSDNMPDGVDVVFNTNKSKTVPMRDVLKPIKVDATTGKPESNPFGSTIKDVELGGQYHYKDKNGNDQLGLINKKSSEGDWEDWSNALPSQFLSKQNKSLVDRQLGIAKDEKKAEYEEICALTNPTVKKQLLWDFAEDCDASAVHLKAAALPRQRYHVIIPMPGLKDNEIYAPGYEDGETVALVRYPHGGTFEIPKCVVNNKNELARKRIPPDVMDAVCINKNVADRLSGADFDGDTVMVIPCSKGISIKSTPQLEGLVGFDPKLDYATTKIGNKYYNEYGKEVKIMSKSLTQTEMGKISNLITDMTILGASDGEKARAVKHSMVVIDAEKHKLDYKRSEIDNDIKSLREKWQKKVNPITGEITYGGAATIISRAKGEHHIEKTQGSGHINMKNREDYDPSLPEGALIYKKADKLYYPEYIKAKPDSDIRGYYLENGKTVEYNKNDRERAAYYKPVEKVDPVTGKVTFTNSTGELTYRTNFKKEKTTKMAAARDAMELVSTAKNPIELAYADYANSLKALANRARKEYASTGEIEYSPTANKIYAAEVKSLQDKLDLSLSNTPRERQATILADSRIQAKLVDNPELKGDKKQLKRLKDLYMKEAREAVGAKRHPIEVTDKEWEAIQAGAISKTKLKDILRFADMTLIRTKAMPRNTKTLTTAQISSIKSKNQSGRYTIKQLAAQYGISESKVREILSGS